MTITPQQLAARRNRVHSSDAAAILGLHPKYSAYDIYLQKTADLEPESDSEQADVGNWLEPSLCRWAGEQVGSNVILSPDTLISPCGILAANLDAIQDTGDEFEPTFFIEAKTSGFPGKWGDYGTDQVPPWVITQTAVAFACCESLRVAWVPVLIGNYGLRRGLYRVDRDDAIVNGVAEQCRQFWHEHVEKRVPPEGTSPNLDLLKRIRREPGSSVYLEDADVFRVNWQQYCRQQATRWEKAAKYADAQLIARLGSTEGANLPDGRIVTYLETHRKGYVVEPTTFRSLKITEPKP